jgi:uncharacterized protein DUF4440
VCKRVLPRLNGKPVPTPAGSRYNHAMRPRTLPETMVHEMVVDMVNEKIVAESRLPFLILMLIFALTLQLMSTSACTFNGDHPARAFSDATGGEGLERVFWKDVQAANWSEVERALASNYFGETPSGALDRDATMEQYRTWKVKDYTLGDLKTELNGTTIVVTYTITLNGVVSNRTAGSQPLPSAPQHMMTVWQQQKKGWVAIAHSVSPNQE